MLHTTHVLGRFYSILAGWSTWVQQAPLTCSMCISQVTALGMKAEVGIFNSIVAACAHSGEHGRARAMFNAMPDHGCAPDAVTFANLIRAYKKVCWLLDLTAYSNSPVEQPAAAADPAA